ncbi:hypothetical protein B4U79_16221 [Dinothrombium tinctorium]|uniref:Uncharacterized protein n=1 Tax=Dinothrombium tinctorium TaxID=1965070 RepID=A0A443QTL9_9ACAR|nr:hypothetical protein B4U79_16221 [Dinothrombium tinctorium]
MIRGEKVIRIDTFNVEILFELKFFNTYYMYLTRLLSSKTNESIVLSLAILALVFSQMNEYQLLEASKLGYCKVLFSFLNEYKHIKLVTLNTSISLAFVFGKTLHLNSIIEMDQIQALFEQYRLAKKFNDKDCLCIILWCINRIFDTSLNDHFKYLIKEFYSSHFLDICNFITGNAEKTLLMSSLYTMNNVLQIANSEEIKRFFIESEMVERIVHFINDANNLISVKSMEIITDLLTKLNGEFDISEVLIKNNFHLALQNFLYSCEERLRERSLLALNYLVASKNVKQCISEHFFNSLSECLIFGDFKTQEELARILSVITFNCNIEEMKLCVKSTVLPTLIDVSKNASVDFVFFTYKTIENVLKLAKEDTLIWSSNFSLWAQIEDIISQNESENKMIKDLSFAILDKMELISKSFAMDL